MTLWYPNEADREKRTYGPGSRIDVDADRVHEVWVGAQGCTYVIGEGVWYHMYFVLRSQCRIESSYVQMRNGNYN